ncbi:MAG: hypothetical protein DWQ05_05125 [Calditrichaeota bacterium]|nr:MAG: hypothetical protein DWQ05_05125 [Calditrichota bacterium]
MKFNLFVTGLIFIALFFTNTLIAQKQLPYSGEYTIPDSNDVQILEMMDGVKLRGKITSISQDKIVFVSSLGTLTIEKSKIKSLRTIEYTKSTRGDLWFRNPNRTRLFFAPTGRMLGAEEGYFSDYYVFFPGIAFGLTSHFTLGGGMSLIPGVGIDRQIFYFTPKVGLIQSEKMNLAAGLLVIKIPGDDEEVAGIAYAVNTWGGEDANFTFGAGYGFVDGDLADKPMLVLGFENRTSERISLVSENWIFPGVDEPLISFGMRFFGEKMSVDLAMWSIVGAEDFFLAPYVDFVYNF